MITSRLNDAAICLHQALTHHSIMYAVIGGYAITHFGGNRQTKDIDCIAIASKAQIATAMKTDARFIVFNGDRRDFVRLRWAEMPNRSDAVDIRIHCSVYPGARFPNALFRFEAHEVKGGTLGKGMVSFHEPFYLFKAALRAAGSRANFVDSVNVRWLVQRYETEIKVRKHKIFLGDVGRALKQHPNLEGVFDPLGVDVGKAKIAAKDFVPFMGSQRLGDVPVGLFDSLADS